MAGRAGWGITHTVTTAYAALSADSIVLDCTIFTFAAGTVTGNITFRVSGQEFDIGDNKTFQLYGIDPSLIEVKGDVDYRVTVFGTVRQVGG